MKIKGSALLARKEIVMRRFGAEAWAQLVADMAATYPYFRAPLVASSLVPVREFLAFHDQMVARFFSGEGNVYFRLGEESAKWALTKGPYRRFLARKDVGEFVESIPNLSSAYWESPATTYRASLAGKVVTLEVTGLPEWHPYFEDLVVGYIKSALELVTTAPVHAERVRGGGGTDYEYRFHVSVP